jgi:colanic acid/amylovoran biosynthesis glycosyltransferase
MGQAGRRRVEEKYDMHKLNDELVEIYQQQLNSKSTHSQVEQLTSSVVET